MPINLARSLLIIVVLIGWEISSYTVADPFLVGRPTAVLSHLWDLIVTGRIFVHGWVTLLETVLGFLAGAFSGILAGLLLGRNETLSRLLEPLIMGFNSLPKVALAPMFIMWFGIGMPMKVVLVATIVFFLVFVSTFTGVRNVSNELISILRLMGANERHLLKILIIPSALQWVFTGLRLSVPYALIGAIVGEMMAANRGLGYLLQDSANQLNISATFAALIGIVVLSLLLNAIVQLVEKWLTPWRSASLGQVAVV